MSEIVRAVELARELRVRPALAYRLPLSRIDTAIAAVSTSPTVGARAARSWRRGSGSARRRKPGRRASADRIVASEPDAVNRR